MAADGADPLPAGRGVGDDLQGGRRLGLLPHRRRSGTGPVRLPRRLPAGRDRAGRRLGRGDAPGRGLGPELPHPGPRRHRLVHPRPARHLPAPGQRPHPGLAVLPLRALAAGDRPRAPGDGQLPLPGPARRRRAGHRRPGHRYRGPRRHRGRRARRRRVADGRLRDPGDLRGRHHRRRARCCPGASRPRSGSGYRSPSAPCTWPGGPASSPARASCTASPTRVSVNRPPATESPAAAGRE